ncbi:putative Serine/threonine-protein kinase-transforming protein raf [Cinnamomum micranthum f. kanehirae]|uniref:Putative Serine/threonine-protein kinase-transforming protein raf n=1 Tax=Cinnamomum micranthum f. kanehirae TaxID=337451 RepID=A0A3S3ME68_9MAGN|nr:putative Serine/threonine-protein kinase-transforming protein raf [Cinnamomum micranthum f. kanehirae]
MNYISICLVDTTGTPFTSALKLRPLNSSMYGAVNESQSLRSEFHIDLGGISDNEEIRYFHSNNLTQKSNVYSFGVVLLELITGQPAISRSKRNLVDWASPIIATKDIQAIVDPRLEGYHDANSLFKAGEIALACTSPRSIDRPTMTDVVAKLKDCLGTETVAEITCSLEMEQLESKSKPRFSSQLLPR